MEIDRTGHKGRRVLVVGLGISGISSAIRLHGLGWQVVVAERAVGRRTGGYFLGVFGAGRASAARMGFLDRMPDRSAPHGVSYMSDRAGRRRLVGEPPGAPWRMMRGDVEEASFAQLSQEVEIRYSTVPTAIDQDPLGVDVTLHDLASDTSVTERFDLVVGADGLRSTVRALAFGPHERFLVSLRHMVVAFQLTRKITGLNTEDTLSILEPSRAMWVWAFGQGLPTAMLSYRTADVDAEFGRPPAERVREVYGPEPPGPLLGQVLDQFEEAEEFLFDSVEQVHMDSWHRGRVVLIGDAAWCMTLYSGMGASAGIAGSELLGTVLHRRPDNVELALTEWETQLRPFVGYHQRTAHDERLLFNPSNAWEFTRRRMRTHWTRCPVVGPVFRHRYGKNAKMKQMDIASA